MEQDIKRQLLLWLGMQRHIMVWNNPTGVARALQPPHQVIRYGLPGSPDIIGVACLPCPHCGQPVGRALGVEVKTPGGRQSPEQRAFAAAWQRRGGVYILAREVDDVKHLQ